MNSLHRRLVTRIVVSVILTAAWYLGNDLASAFLPINWASCFRAISGVFLMVCWLACWKTGVVATDNLLQKYFGREESARQ